LALTLQDQRHLDGWQQHLGGRRRHPDSKP
jgi:hypothetical protein